MVSLPGGQEGPPLPLAPLYSPSYPLLLLHPFSKPRRCMLPPQYHGFVAFSGVAPSYPSRVRTTTWCLVVLLAGAVTSLLPSYCCTDLRRFSLELLFPINMLGLPPIPVSCPHRLLVGGTAVPCPLCSSCWPFCVYWLTALLEQR